MRAVLSLSAGDAARRVSTDEVWRTRSLGAGVDFTQTGGFASQLAQIIQLRAPHLRGAQDVDFVDDLGLDGEDSLDALSKADLADGEAGLRAARPRNDNAFERLDAFLVAFLDLDLNFDGVSGAEVRDVGAAALRQQSFDDLVCHDASFLKLGAEA